MASAALRFNLTPVTARAYTFLKSRILSGIFKPGEFLSAGKISHEIGIRRTPIKDALRYLEIDGLVTVEPKMGAVVMSVSEEQLREMLGYRKALQAFAAEEAACARSAGDLEEISLVLKKMRRCLENLNSPRKVAEAMALGERLHHLVVRSAHNSEVERRFENLQQVLQINRHDTADWRNAAEGLTQDVGDFEKILEAISSRDGSLARRVLNSQLDRLASLILGNFINRQLGHLSLAGTIF